MPGRLSVAMLVPLLAALALARPASVSACTCAYVAPLDALAHADAVVDGFIPLIADLGTITYPLREEEQ